MIFDQIKVLFREGRRLLACISSGIAKVIQEDKKKTSRETILILNELGLIIYEHGLLAIGRKKALKAWAIMLFIDILEWSLSCKHNATCTLHFTQMGQDIVFSTAAHTTKW